MNAARPIAGSVHVDVASFLWLKPVRSAGSFVHLVPRDALQIIGGPPKALCGEEAPILGRGVRRWRVVHAPSAKVCMTCHAGSVAGPSRIDWS